jgi:hypothetical protein
MPGWAWASDAAPVAPMTYSVTQATEEDAAETRAVPPEPDLKTEDIPAQAEIDDMQPALDRLLADLGEAAMDDPGKAALTREVATQVARLRGVQRAWFQRSLARGWKYQPMLRAALLDFGLPEDLAWLPLIESGFQYRARSSAGALGLWQLMPDTARFHSMSVHSMNDERLDPVRATLAAREYLRDRLASLGRDQVLVAAATYNAGEGRVREVMKRTGGADFMTLRPYLPSETAAYVPLFLAAALIGRDPAAYGFHADERADRIVLIRERRPLAELAQAFKLPMQTLRAFNDDLPTGATMTPVSNFPLRLPASANLEILAGNDHLLLWDQDEPAGRSAWRAAMVLPAFNSGAAITSGRVTETRKTARISSCQAVPARVQAKADRKTVNGHGKLARAVKTKPTAKLASKGKSHKLAQAKAAEKGKRGHAKPVRVIKVAKATTKKRQTKS